MIYPEHTYRVELCLLLPKNEIYYSMGNAYILIPVVLLITGMFILVIFQKVTQYFVRPMDSLREAMIKMQGGDFDVRMDNSPSFYEFALLNDNFDRMAEKIKELKISVYEQKLEKQSVELRYLQHQINPHFITNCLNTIRNLIIMGDTDRAEKFTALLGRNIRYDLTTRMRIMLDEEINHVKSYVALQQIRYEKQLKVRFQVDDSLKSCEVPSMIIQTFVENSVKHQICSDTVLDIFVFVRRENEKIYIVVEDDGDGFSDDILFRIQNREHIIKNGMEHIGIENVVRRLEIMYKGRADITFSNTERGAKVAIELPMEAEAEA